MKGCAIALFSFGVLIVTLIVCLSAGVAIIAMIALAADMLA